MSRNGDVAASAADDEPPFRTFLKVLSTLFEDSTLKFSHHPWTSGQIHRRSFKIASRHASSCYLDAHDGCNQSRRGGKAFVLYRPRPARASRTTSEECAYHGHGHKRDETMNSSTQVRSFSLIREFHLADW